MSKRTIWKMRFVFWGIVAVTAVGLGAFCAVKQVDDSTFKTLLISYVIVMILGWYAVNMFCVVRLAKRVNSLLPVLTEENDPERYLMQLTELIGNSGSRAFRGIYHINSAAAYCDMQEYEKARSVLSEIKPESVPGANRLAYYLNMALICMHLGEDDEALRIWNEHKNEFEKYSNNENMGAAIATLRIFSMIREGRAGDVPEEIRHFRSRWTRKRELKEADFLESMIK